MNANVTRSSVMQFEEKHAIKPLRRAPSVAAAENARARARARRVTLTIPGRPIPLGRARVGGGRHYLPASSRAYRETVQGCWLAAGRPTLGDAPFALSARFYGARKNADLDNLLKALLDALGTLTFTDDRNLVCIAGAHKLAADSGGPRAEVTLWTV